MQGEQQEFVLVTLEANRNKRWSLIFHCSTKPVTGRNKDERLNMQGLLQSKPDGEKLTWARVALQQNRTDPDGGNVPVERGNKLKQKKMSTYIFIELRETWAQVEYGWQVSTNITRGFDGVRSCWTLDEETERCKM